MTAPACACIPGRGELFARSCPGPTPGAYRVGYGAGDGTDEPCDCRCHEVHSPSETGGGMICRDCRGDTLVGDTTCPECAARAARSVEIDPEFDLNAEIERHMLCVGPSDPLRSLGDRPPWVARAVAEPGIVSHGTSPRDAVAAWLSGDRWLSASVPLGVGHEAAIGSLVGGDYADELRMWDELRPRLLDAGILRPDDPEAIARYTTRDDRARLATLLAQIEALAQ